MTTEPTPVYPDDASEIPPLRLHSADSVGMATFLGTPLAGSVVMALNERALGRSGRAWAVVGGGLLVTAVWLAVAQWLPKGAAMGGNIGLTLGARALASHWVAEANAEGRLGEVQWHSKWRAAGVGFIGLVLVLGAIFAAFSVGPDSLQDRVAIRPNVHIYYTDGATADDARRVGARLDAMQALSTTHEQDLRYARTARGHALSFVVAEGTLAADPQLIEAFRTVGRDLQPRTDPLGALEVRLCDDEWHAHRTLSFPEAAAP